MDVTALVTTAGVRIDAVSRHSHGRYQSSFVVSLDQLANMRVQVIPQMVKDVVDRVR